jgi:hypothetical protein
LLNFGDRDPTIVLRPLHKLMDKWPSDWFDGIPSWIIPMDARERLPKLGRRRTQAFKKSILDLFASNTSRINQVFQQSIGNAPSLAETSKYSISNFVFFDLDLSQFLKRVEHGCLFFQALESSNLAEWRKINDGRRFILAAEDMIDRVIFGIPEFDYRRFTTGVNLAPVRTFKWIVPQG